MVGKFNNYRLVSSSFQFVGNFNILRSNRNFKRLLTSILPPLSCCKRSLVHHGSQENFSSYIAPVCLAVHINSYISSCCSLTRFLAAANSCSLSEHCFVTFVSDFMPLFPNCSCKLRQLIPYAFIFSSIYFQC